ncbi:small fragment nuclease isoform X3 [Electrophorus electricus]|nr:small fragment nuclease isoform X3 [Electrophorus electricus]
MTGLDIEKDQIIEMACIITDSDLNILAEGPNLIISQPNELLESMSDWCKEHHGKSGLTQAVRDSKITLRQAEYEFLSFIRQHTPPGHCPLAGNSVHADKRFLDKYMPQFMRHLHYRIVDVSTVKELCRWEQLQTFCFQRFRCSAKAAQAISMESCSICQFWLNNKMSDFYKGLWSSTCKSDDLSALLFPVCCDQALVSRGLQTSTTEESITQGAGRHS